MGANRNREPRSPLRDELEFYFVEAKAYGVRCSLGASGARSSDHEGRVSAGMHDSYDPRTRREFDSPASRERMIHEAIVSLSLLHQAALRARYEPRRWPRDVWAWGDLVGVVMLTTEARDAHAKAVAPRGKRRVWRQQFVAVSPTSVELRWLPNWLDSTKCPATRLDGILDWLGSKAVRTDADLGVKLKSAGEALLSDAMAAYGAARGLRPADDAMASSEATGAKAARQSASKAWHATKAGTLAGVGM